MVLMNSGEARPLNLYLEGRLVDDAFAPPITFAFVVCPTLDIVALIIKGANAWVVATNASIFTDGTAATTTAAAYQ